MLSLSDFFQQDIFLAVFFYLSAGLVFVLIFLYTEKKWESELQRYQIRNIAPYLAEQHASEKNNRATPSDILADEKNQLPDLIEEASHDKNLNDHRQ